MAGITMVLFVALGLSADCFAVAVSAGLALKKPTLPQTLRVALAFGGFQAFMPFLGWLAGERIIDYISPYDHWLAFALLAAVGGHMLWEAFHEEEVKADIFRGLTLLVLSIATSIDALAVGLSFAFLDVSVGLAVSIIGGVAFLVTGLGIQLGPRVGEILGRRAEIVGGLVLIGIGVKILFDHLLEAI